MICIKCFHGKTSVTNSRPHKSSASIWRRRQCQRCNSIFTTVEVPEIDDSILINAQPLSTPRLTVELAGYLSHHGHQAADDAYWLTNTIVQSLWATKKTALSSDELKQTVYEILERFDAAAGLRYATEHALIQNTRKPRRGRPRLTRL